MAKEKDPNRKIDPRLQRGGRKNAYQEYHDGKFLYELFFGQNNKKKIKEMMAKGKYSIKDKFVEKALDGNERVMVEIFKKLIPDKIENDFKRPVSILITRGDSEQSNREEDGHLSGANNALASEDSEGMETSQV